MSESNIQTVQAIYQAFGRGDVPAVLERMAAGEIAWDYSVSGSDVPWHEPVRRREDLPKFFTALASQVEMRSFEPHAFVAGDRDVAVRVRASYVVKRTGRPVTMEQVHWWGFDASGRVASLRHFEDTHAVITAWRG